MKMKALIPYPIKALYWRGHRRYLRLRPSYKLSEELRYWDVVWELQGGSFQDGSDKRTMLGMAQEEDQSFLQGKIVADFGCGPSGSLCWATEARLRIGIDILADAYTKFNTKSHDMVYVCATEEQIPLPSGYVDVLYTVNAMDHVWNFKVMCKELRRILAPGGVFLASFNLQEPTTACEPQCLTEEKVHEHLLQHLDVVSYRQAQQGKDYKYRHFFDGNPPKTTGQRFLWVRAGKPEV